MQCPAARRVDHEGDLALCRSGDHASPSQWWEIILAASRAKVSLGTWGLFSPLVVAVRSKAIVRDKTSTVQLSTSASSSNRYSYPTSFRLFP